MYMKCTSNIQSIKMCIKYLKLPASEFLTEKKILYFSIFTSLRVLNNCFLISWQK